MDTAFVVEFDVETAVILDRGISLPGLLARIIADAGDPDPLPKVPLASLEGIFAGSDVFVLWPAVEYHVAYVRSLRPSAMPHDLALRDRRGRPMSQIVLRDEFKNLLDRRVATSAGMLVAFGTGDVEKISALLGGLNSIGAKRSSGHGAVTAVRVTPIEHPHAGFADREGNPTRAVPVHVWRAMNLPPRPVRSLVARLPRWAAPREPCVGPRDWEMAAATYDREVSG